MTFFARNLIYLLVVFGSTYVRAFELATHAALTARALQRSTIASDGNQLVRTLGVDTNIWNPAGPLTSVVNVFGQNLHPTERPFASSYYDSSAIPSPTGNRLRTSSPYENSIITSWYLGDVGLSTAPHTLQGWFMRGAIREDDIVTTDLLHRDPFGNFNRVCNHFYDPAHDTALTAFCPLPGGPASAKNPDWALGYADSFGYPTVDVTRRNHFTLQDAREAEYRALTGLDFQNGNAPVAPTQADRNAYWATLFRSLGDLAHLVEDMAQPQHTRDEAHSGLAMNSGLGGHSSHFEWYLESRVQQEVLKSFADFNFGGVGEPLPSVSLDSDPAYPIPDFAYYTAFWSTTPHSTGGRGLADYSNNGFFSFAKNYGDATMPLPVSDAGLYSEVSVTRPIGGMDSMTDKYLVGDVSDANRSGETSKIKMTRKSMWDLAAGGGTDAVYTLDVAIYDDQAGLLLPRAVAYAAGFFNHFFRGSMAVSLPSDGVYAIADQAKAKTGKLDGHDVGFDTIRLRLQNTTPDIVDGGTSFPQDMSGRAIMSGGTLVAFGTSTGCDAAGAIRSNAVPGELVAPNRKES